MNRAESADTSGYVLKHLLIRSLRDEYYGDQYYALLWYVVATPCLRCWRSVACIYVLCSRAPAARYGVSQCLLRRLGATRLETRTKESTYVRKYIYDTFMCGVNVTVVILAAAVDFYLRREV